MGVSTSDGGTGTPSNDLGGIISIGYSFLYRQISLKFKLNVATYTAQDIVDVKTFISSTVFSSATFSGNVGIGTTNPGARLDVRGIDTQAFNLAVGTATTPYSMVVTTSGNVGIGTTSPGAKLDCQSGPNSYGLRLGFGDGDSSKDWIFGNSFSPGWGQSSKALVIGTLDATTKYYGDGSGLYGVTGTIDNAVRLDTGTVKCSRILTHFIF